MAKVLLIDKDIHTINPLTIFLATLDLETVLVHNWPSQVKSLELEKPELVFVNVELPTVHIDKVFESFNKSSPIIYFYSRTFDPMYIKAKEFPYSGDLKKPVRMDEVYTLLEKFIQINNLPGRISDYYSQLSGHKVFQSEFSDWVRKLKTVLLK